MNIVNIGMDGVMKPVNIGIDERNETSQYWHRRRVMKPFYTGV